MEAYAETQTQTYYEPEPRYWTKFYVDEIAARSADVLRLDPGADLRPIIEGIGGKIVIGYQRRDEFDGGSIVVRNWNDFTIVLSEVTSPKRDRFTLAHELGHLFLHYEPLVDKYGSGVIMRATRDKRPGDPAHERAEWEANWFAAGFLLPEPIFREKCGSLSNRDLATLFNVSDQVVEIRRKTLQI